jgi:hypothetical protein
MKTPTDATKVFNTLARTGTNTTTSVTGAGFSPDLVFSQSRPGGYENQAYDRLRGKAKLLMYSTSSESTTGLGFDSFNMDGLNLTADSYYGINGPSITYANWLFRRAPGFFDVVCFTGSSSGSQTIPHNLGVAPELLITKARSAAVDWYTYSATLGINAFLRGVNSVNGSETFSGMWPNTPTASNFYINVDNVGLSSRTAVAYLFASCPGVSKVGNYTGTGTTKQIDCGFTAGARFVMIKRTDSTGDWYVWDTARGIISGNDPYLLLNSTAAEVTGTDYIDPYSAGFEISSTAPAAINANGGSFIFLAIA